MVQIKKVSIHFLLPAFLGNAEQVGQWRTPPFKHVLREWWRVAYAKHNDFNVTVEEMRNQEARLFGSAGGEGGRSLVRLRLSRWDKGKMHQWEEHRTVNHPEVRKPVGAHLYLGFGPLTYDRRNKGTKLKESFAIEAHEKAEFRLAVPSGDSTLINHAIDWMGRFGAMGSRSRNGWGSFEFLDEAGKPFLADADLPLRDWQDCLSLEWAHAIGQDQKGALIWRTNSFDDWKKLMQELAKIKIALRTHFPFSSGNNAGSPENRHWLSYPVTNHKVKSWGDTRLPNSLRFKARRDAQREKLFAVIFHMPCKPPASLRPDNAALTEVWRSVHRFLDNHANLQRSAE